MSKWETIDDSKFAWRKLLGDIHTLEPKYRQHPYGLVEKTLTKFVDQFLEFALPACQIWRNKTVYRHPNRQITDRLKDVVDKAERAKTLDEKLVAIELLVNAHHQTNKFGQAVNELYDGKHPLLH